MASSSPYRTPESTSKASFLLSKTPFGTPVKTSTPTVYGTVPPPGGRPPVNVSTSKASQAWALSKSLLDGGAAYATLALRGRSHLPFSSLFAVSQRTNWVPMCIVALLGHHILFSMSLFAPSHPIQGLFLALRPTNILISMLTFAAMALVVVLHPGHQFSLVQKRWATANKITLQDKKFGGFTIPSGSPASILLARINQATLWRAVVLHSLLGFLLGLMQAVALMLSSSQPELWLPYHVVPIRSPHSSSTTVVRPNERLFVLVLGNAAICGLAAWTRSLQTSSPAPTPGAPFCEPKFEAQVAFATPLGRLGDRLQRARRRVFLLGGLGPLVLLQLYLVWRRPFFRLVLSVIGHRSPLRPMLIPSFKRALVSSELVYRVWLLGLASVCILEFFDTAWEVYASHPVDFASGGVSKFAREPTRCLIRGMQLRRTAFPEEQALGPVERDYYAHFAFSEMALIAATDVERRKAIFRDVGTNGLPSTDGAAQSAWAQVASECLVVLREERQRLLQKGKPSPSADTPSAAADTRRTTSANEQKPTGTAHQIPVSNDANILKNRPVSVWEKLASTAVGSRPNPQTISVSTPAPATGPSSVQSSDSGLRSILHSIAPPTAAPSVGTSTQRNRPALASSIHGQQPHQPAFLVAQIAVTAASTLLNTLKVFLTLLPADLQHVIRHSVVVRCFTQSREWFVTPSDKVLLSSGSVPSDTALATWSVQTLSALLAASLDQDEFGTVALSAHAHLGLDNVLEEFSALLLALHSFYASMQSTHGPGALIQFIHVAGPLMEALRTGITLIVGVFEPTGVQIRAATRAHIEKALAASHDV